MANLSDNKHVYNKAFSHKAISGGKMKIGTLVSQSGMLGVIVDNHWRKWRAHWATANSSWVDEIYLTVEVK